MTSLTEETMGEVFDCSSSYATWKVLELAFAHSSASRSHQLWKELLSLQHGDSSIEEYGKKIYYLCDKISAVGRLIEESDKSHWFLSGLGLQFARFADTRMALTPLPTFRDLLHQTRQFEIMLKAMETKATPTTTFMVDRNMEDRANPNHGSSSNRNSGSGGGYHSKNSGNPSRGGNQSYNG